MPIQSNCACPPETEISLLKKINNNIAVLNTTVGSGGGGGGTGTVTSVSVTTANGVSGSVANPTTTPAITLTLGAITPSSVTTGAVTSSTLTSGRVPFASTGGLLTDDADLTFSVDTLTATKGTFGGITHVSGVITSAAGSTLTMATLDTNKNILIQPNGSGVVLVGAAATASAVYGSVNTTSGIRWESGANNRAVLVGGGTDLAYLAGNSQMLEMLKSIIPASDLNGAAVGGSGSRFNQGFFGPSGLRIGNGSTGPTITATGTSPNEQTVFTASTGTGGWTFTGATTAVALQVLDTGGQVITLQARDGGGSSTISLGNGTSTSGIVKTPNSIPLVFQYNSTEAARFASSTSFQLVGLVTKYNNIATAGLGVPAVYGAAEVTAQSAANASIATYTVGAADGTFEVGAQVNVTAATALSTTITCTYTDKSNTSRTMIFPIQQLTGSFIAGGLITGVGAWETPFMQIRCKASTAITIGTTAGTFTGVTYSADATITQKS